MRDSFWQRNRALIAALLLAILMGVATVWYFQDRISTVSREQVTHFEEQARKIDALERIAAERQAIDEERKHCGEPGRAACSELDARLAALEAQADRIGIQGLPGEPGADGKDGRDGRDGADGHDGASIQGPPGEKGEKGDPGEPGSPAPTPSPAPTETVTATPTPEPCTLPPPFCP